MGEWPALDTSQHHNSSPGFNVRLNIVRPKPGKRFTDICKVYHDEDSACSTDYDFTTKYRVVSIKFYLLSIVTPEDSL